MDIEADLRELLESEANQSGPISHEALEVVLRRSRRRRGATAAVASLTLLAVALGGVLAVRLLTPASDLLPAGPQRIGAEVVIGSGTEAGVSWRLLAYRSNLGLCVDLEIGSGRGGGCGLGVPNQRDLSVSQGTQEGLDRITVDGVISRRVASVEIRVHGGPTFKPEILRGPLEFGVDFFVEFLPAGATASVVAKDHQGEVVGRASIAPVSLSPRAVFTEDVLDEQKITVYYLSGWNRSAETLAPNLPAARELVSLGTYPLRPGGGKCGPVPEVALKDLGSEDAFVTIQETTPLGAPPRPGYFSFDLGTVPAWAPCLQNGKMGDLRQFRFSDQSRSFVAYVAVGNQASKETREGALGILDHLLVCDLFAFAGNC